MGELLTVPEAEYHADKSRVSNSMIEDWLKDRQIFEARHVRGFDNFKPKPPMVLGSFVEALLCEDEETVRARYAGEPEKPEEPGKCIHRGTNEYKAWKASIGDRIPIAADVVHNARRMVTAVQDHPVAGPFFLHRHDASLLLWTRPS